MQRYKKPLAAAIAVLVLLMAAAYIYLGTSPLKAGSDAKPALLIDDDDDIDSVYAKLEPHLTGRGMSAFRFLASRTGYKDHVHAGFYQLEPGVSVLTMFRRIRNGVQTPVQLAITATWTVEHEAARIARQLQCDSAEIVGKLKDSAWCSRHGFDTATVACVLLPDNYEVYWNIKAEHLLERMVKEYHKFWTHERQAKAARLQLTPNEVTILASIVDAETTHEAEKPMVAGLYYNRLKRGMPLQADPTVKFALRQFSLKRIYSSMLHTESPYNTYINKGLPPGPIRIATKTGIDAVLNMQRHEYIYMCAKEDFSGTHNFATTYAEHQSNAEGYAKALNQRKIK